MNKHDYEDFFVTLAKRVSAKTGFAVEAKNVSAIFWAINEYVARKLIHNDIILIKNFFSIYMVRRQNINREGFFVKFVLHKSVKDFLRSMVESKSAKGS